MKKLKTLILCILIIILTALMAVPAFAYVPSGRRSLTAVSTLFSGEIIQWDFEYRDSFFEHRPEEYDHMLARASLGMAISSYRNNAIEELPKDVWIEQYMSQAGFTNLRSEGYDKTPGAHTVSSMIGSKQIGKSTLIAVVPCGGGYKDEWLSNFTVGTGRRHEGFEEAALLVEGRIIDYIKDYGVNGDIKLWVSGYSRGAAVANIVEADMTEIGMFQAVYGYNFATPRTTKTSGDYKNIFNIMGKYDPVPMIPFAEWGYQRYGIDLFTPAMEMDSFYFEKTVGADKVSRELLGRKFTNNPEINGQLHMLLEYLLQILPTDEDYREHLEEALKEAWVAGSFNRLLEIIEEAVSNMKYLNAEQQTEADAMLNYLDNVVMAYLKGNRQREKDGYWDSSDDLGTNLIREHNPSTYIEWMYSSDDPKDIFTDSLTSKKVIFTGKASVEIYGADGYIETVEENGEITRKVPDGEAVAAPSRRIYAVHKGSQAIISLPGDMTYQLIIHATKDDTLGYMVSTYSTNQLSADTTKLISFSAKKGDCFILTVNPKAAYPVLTDGNGNRVASWPSSIKYTPAMILQLENLNVFHISIGSMIGLLAGTFAFLFLTIIVVTIVSIVHTITCRRRGRPYSKYTVIVPHLLLVLLFFLMGELTGYLLSAFSIVAAIYTTIGSLILTLMAIRGSVRYRNKRNTIIWGTLLILTVAIFFLFYFTGFGSVSVLQFIVMGLYFTLGSIAAIYTFPHEGKRYWKREKT
ncbi:MAG: hypothetical protein MJ092_00615 [Lachnospiraceae bacterium]|nr:hypothetical protein [Lachnospiraceae bacterium]